MDYFTCDADINMIVARVVTRAYFLSENIDTIDIYAIRLIFMRSLFKFLHEKNGKLYVYVFGHEMFFFSRRNLYELSIK